METSGTPRRRRRATTNQLVTIYWRDIPAQVTATIDGEKGSWLLEARFQVAIDRAATIAGLTAADDYVLHWRRVTTPCNGDPDTVVRAAAEQLQQDYDRERVRSLVQSGGLDPAPQQPCEPPPSIHESAEGHALNRDLIARKT